MKKYIAPISLPPYASSLPVAFDDTLTYAEQLSKMIFSVNKAISLANSLVRYIKAEGLPDNLQIIVDNTLNPIIDELGEIQTTLTNYGEEIEDINTKIAELQSKDTEFEGTIGLLNTTIESHVERLNTIDEAIENILLNLESIQSDFNEYKTETDLQFANISTTFFQMFNRIGDVELEIAEIGPDVTALKTWKATTINDIDTMQAHIGGLLTRVTDLEEEIINFPDSPAWELLFEDEDGVETENFFITVPNLEEYKLIVVVCIGSYSIQQSIPCYLLSLQENVEGNGLFENGITFINTYGNLMSYCIKGFYEFATSKLTLEMRQYGHNDIEGVGHTSYGYGAINYIWGHK